MSTAPTTNQKADRTTAAAAAMNGITPRLEFIDGLRGMAILLVLIYHCWLFGGLWDAHLAIGHHRLSLSSLVQFGHIGVNLFLVLSGFCLYWPFVKKLDNGTARVEPTLRQFAWKRCHRILPPYYATLVGCAIAAAIGGSDTGQPVDGHFILTWLGVHAVMLHNMDPRYILSLDGSLWSLGLEFQLYILFVVLVELFRRFNPRGVLLGVFLLSTAYRFFLVKSGVLTGTETSYTLAYSVFGRCFEFTLGMFAARILANRDDAGGLPVKAIDYAALLGIGVLGVLDGHHGHYQTLTDAMWGMLFAALLLAASGRTSVPHGILSQPWLVKLGYFSYSIYLIHLPIVIWLGHVVMRHPLLASHSFLFSIGVIIPLVLVLSYGFHLVFERPFMRSHKRPKAVAAAAPVVA